VWLLHWFCKVVREKCWFFIGFTKVVRENVGKPLVVKRKRADNCRTTLPGTVLQKDPQKDSQKDSHKTRQRTHKGLTKGPTKDSQKDSQKASQREKMMFLHWFYKVVREKCGYYTGFTRLSAKSVGFSLVLQRLSANMLENH
jgi:hypothetical protein